MLIIGSSIGLKAKRLCSFLVLPDCSAHTAPDYICKGAVKPLGKLYKYDRIAFHSVRSFNQAANCHQHHDYSLTTNVTPFRNATFSLLF